MSELDTISDQDKTVQSLSDEPFAIHGDDGGLIVGVVSQDDIRLPLTVTMNEREFRGEIGEGPEATRLFTFDMENGRLRDAVVACVARARRLRRDPALTIWQTNADNLLMYGNVRFAI